MINVMEKKEMLQIVKYKVKYQKLPKKMKPLQILFLADLHDRVWGEHQNILLEQIEALHGDLVLCAGDMLVAEKHARMEHAMDFFRELQKTGLPVICGNGNHESRMRQCPERYGMQYEQYVGVLQECGVQILEDESCSFLWDGQKFQIYGYELPLAYYKKFRQPPYDTSDLNAKFGRPEEDAVHILLAHNPVYFDTYAEWGADLTLSGHLHGGIIRIPGIGGLITPQAKLFPKYDRGLIQKRQQYMTVSAGLGEHTVPIRICNPPQLIRITVEGTAEEDGIICKN